MTVGHGLKCIDNICTVYNNSYLYVEFWLHNIHNLQILIKTEHMGYIYKDKSFFLVISQFVPNGH